MSGVLGVAAQLLRHRTGAVCARTLSSRLVQPTTTLPLCLRASCAATGAPARFYSKKQPQQPQGRSKKKREALEARRRRQETTSGDELNPLGLRTEDMIPDLDFTPHHLNTNLVRVFEEEEMAANILEQDKFVPPFFAGSILRVTYLESMSDKSPKTSVGICIARFNKSIASNFIIRNVLSGVSYEERFYIFSPLVLGIEVIELSRRRRAKLYYLRNFPDKFSQVSPRLEAMPIPKKVPISRPRTKRS